MVSVFTVMFGFFGFGSLFEAGLLIINAIAILNEERFLNKSKYP